MLDDTNFFKKPAKCFMAAGINRSNHGNCLTMFVVEWDLKYPFKNINTLTAVRIFTFPQILI